MKSPSAEKLARQRATAQMPKCKCGNVAKHGQELCGRCEDEAREGGPDTLEIIRRALESRLDRIAIDALGREQGIESRQVRAVTQLIAEIVYLNGLKTPG